MKKSVLYFAALLFVLCLQARGAAAQTKFAVDWMRVQSDEGEFSVEVPADYDFISEKTDDYPFGLKGASALRNAKIFAAYSDKTLIAFERYKAGKGALNEFKERDRAKGKTSEIKCADGTRIKQVVTENEKYYAVRQYFSTKNYIYVLTAASRNGETQALKRFLNSLVIKSAAAGTDADKIAGARLFSTLKTTDFEIAVRVSLSENSENPRAAPPKIENLLPLLIMSKPLPSFTLTARDNQEVGQIRVRVKFSKRGLVSGVVMLQTLGSGLSEQAIIAALRIKFLPEEKDGAPVDAARVIEYSFDIH